MVSLCALRPSVLWNESSENGNKNENQIENEKRNESKTQHRNGYEYDEAVRICWITRDGGLCLWRRSEIRHIEAVSKSKDELGPMHLPQCLIGLWYLKAVAATAAVASECWYSVFHSPLSEYPSPSNQWDRSYKGNDTDAAQSSPDRAERLGYTSGYGSGVNVCQLNFHFHLTQHPIHIYSFLTSRVTNIQVRVSAAMVHSNSI